MNIEDLAQRSGEWLRGTGPNSDIVVSSRIRLARNLAEFPFIRKCTGLDRAGIEETLQQRLSQLSNWSELSYIDVNSLDEIDRQFLVERQLISREHADADGARGVAIDSREQCSLMINEEDHLRIQVMHSGLDLEAAWQEATSLDDLKRATEPTTAPKLANAAPDFKKSRLFIRIFSGWIRACCARRKFSSLTI